MTTVLRDRPGAADEPSSTPRRPFRLRGDLLAVVATSALELGIDIGLLDCAVVVGFPGTMASLRQRWGRAGRTGSGLSILVASPDALDQYLMAHPARLLERPVEAAILAPDADEVRRAVGLVLDDGDTGTAHVRGLVHVRANGRLSSRAAVSVNRPAATQSSPNTVVSRGSPASSAKAPDRMLHSRALTTWAASRRRADRVWRG